MKISFVGANRTLPTMNDTLIGYARCSTDKQDLTAQREWLRELGVTEKRIYLDHGLTGTNRKRPGLDQALAAVLEESGTIWGRLRQIVRLAWWASSPWAGAQGAGRNQMAKCGLSETRRRLATATMSFRAWQSAITAK